MINTRSIAILPTQKEYYLLSGRLKSMLNKAGFTCIDGKDDPMLDEILKEIEWSERKSDIIDPSTAVKFGKLKAFAAMSSLYLLNWGSSCWESVKVSTSVR